MTRKTLKLLAFLLVLNNIIITVNAKNKLSNDYTGYVNPFIGTSGTGHTFPGACVPFGNIQAGPETGNFGWAYTAGYQYKDPKITGFSQNRLNGTGIADLGDLPIMPFSGDIVRPNYSSTFSKSTEIAAPGYYSVELADHAVKTEITAAAHTSLYRLTYNGDLSPHLLIDFQSNLCSASTFPTHILSSRVNFESSTSISGTSQSNLWVNRNYYYVITFSKPYTQKTVLAKRASTEKADRYVFDFDLKKGEQLFVKISISSVSIEGAKANQLAEVPDWNFDLLRESTRHSWNDLLSRVQITGTDTQMTTFYTSMYHNFIQPNNIADVNETPFYSTFSLWDTFRASHPLYTLICPEKVNDFVHSFLKQYDKTGYMPIWTLWGIENRCMIANHSVPVLVDAYLKGFRGFDVDKAYLAVKQSLTVNHPASNWTVFDQYGYLPTDIVKNENVSTTLESAYDAYCAAQFAKALNKTDDYTFFMKRAMSYKNLFDNESGLMRGKSSTGVWTTPFDKLSISHGSSAGGNYTEGNAWQYTWQVQHDVKGLIDLMGGNDAFVNKLDTLFTMSSQIIASGSSSDISGMIGQYAHGNEPCHHVAYLYSLAGQRQKTAAIVRKVCNTQYLNKPNGLSGNDDCGQMSAWNIFSIMGFYPVNPCGGEYVLGEAQVDKAQINLSGGNVFSFERIYLTDPSTTSYIEFNGERYNKNTISHQEILAGGSLKFYVHKQLSQIDNDFKTPADLSAITYTGASSWSIYNNDFLRMIVGPGNNWSNAIWQPEGGLNFEMDRFIAVKSTKDNITVKLQVDGSPEATCGKDYSSAIPGTNFFIHLFRLADFTCPNGVPTNLTPVGTLYTTKMSFSTANLKAGDEVLIDWVKTFPDLESAYSYAFDNVKLDVDFKTPESLNSFSSNNSVTSAPFIDGENLNMVCTSGLNVLTSVIYKPSTGWYMNMNNCKAMVIKMGGAHGPIAKIWSQPLNIDASLILAPNASYVMNSTDKLFVFQLPGSLANLSGYQKMTNFQIFAEAQSKGSIATVDWIRTFASKSDADHYVASITDTSNENIQELKSNFKVFKVGSRICIEGMNAPTLVEIFDANGGSVYSSIQNNGTISTFPKGAYFVKCKDTVVKIVL